VTPSRLAIAAIAWAFACAPLAASAQATPTSAPTIAQMRARDRYAPPAPELAAWEAFHAQVAADPASSPALRAESHLGRAIARFYAKQYEGGWEDVRAAEALVATLPESPAFHSELLAFGSVLLVELGRLDEAEPYAARAFALAEQRPGADRRDLVIAHNALAVLAFARNDLPGAEAGFCTARDLALAYFPPEDPEIVNNAGSCGVLKYFLERPDMLDAMRLASDHALAHLPPNHPRMGQVLNGSYAVMMLYGRYGEAEPLIRRHLDLERALYAGDSDDIYDPLSMLARVLELRGRLEEAEGMFTAAAAMAGRIANRGQPYTAGIAQINLALVIGRLGRLAEAEGVARAGVARLRADLAPDDWNIGSGESRLAALVGQQGRSDEALALSTEALSLLEPKLAEDHSEVLVARLTHARILADLGRGDEAMALAAPAVARFETRLFDLAASETEQVALSEVLPQALGDYLAVALASGAMEEAVRGAQLLLLSELAVVNARIAAAAIARREGLGEGVERLETARAEVERLSGELAAAQAGEGTQAPALAASLAAARADAEAAQAALLVAFPDFVALARPRIASLAQLQAGLDEGELLVLPVALTDRAVTLAISRDGVRWGETPITGYDLHELTAQVRRSVERPGVFDAEAAHRLYGIVFPDSLAPLLARHRQVLFPASGYLARLSPGVLLTAPATDLAHAPWLMRSHALRVVPDLAALHGDPTRSAATRFLGIGAPRLTDSAAAWAALPPLPGAGAELAALGAALGTQDNTLLTDGDATEAALAARDLASYRVIAFATHGLVGGEVPGLAEPALVMSTPAPGDADHDGLLTASEIAGLRLDAEWVILSACNTASGELAGSPGFSGLARAFAQAGARSLMLSHWRVRDDAAAFLSVETMRRAAAGMPRAEALQQAQLALMARTDLPDAAHPSVWAPFVMMGN